MFRNFLTCHFAEAFVRDCTCLDFPTASPALLDELRRCANGMLVHFHRAIRTEEAPERSRALFVSLTYLQDCKCLFEKLGTFPHDIMCRYEVLEGRLADLMVQASAGENGQLRMFG